MNRRTCPTDGRTQAVQATTAHPPYARFHTLRIRLATPIRFTAPADRPINPRGHHQHPPPPHSTRATHPHAPLPGGPASSSRRRPTRCRDAARGEFPERSKGSDCKSDGFSLRRFESCTPHSQERWNERRLQRTSTRCLDVATTAKSGREAGDARREAGDARQAADRTRSEPPRRTVSPSVEPRQDRMRSATTCARSWRLSPVRPPVRRRLSWATRSRQAAGRLRQPGSSGRRASGDSKAVTSRV